MNKDKVVAALTAKIESFDFHFEYHMARILYQGARYFHLFYIVETDEIEFRPTDEDHDDPYTGLAPEIFIGTMNFVSASHPQDYAISKLKAIPRYLGE